MTSNGCITTAAWYGHHMNTASDTATTVKLDGRTWTVTTYTDPYPGRAGSDRITTRDMCTRCGGTGIFTWWTAMGEARGTCFLCLGTRVVEHSRAVSALRREAKVDAVWAEHGETMRAESAAKYAEVASINAARDYAEAWDAAHTEQARRAELVDGYVAEVGAKVDVIGTITAATTFEARSFSPNRDYELKALVVVTLDDGRVIKTVGTGQTLFDAERDTRVRVRGAVKAHGAYQGQDQTILTRAKITPA